MRKSDSFGISNGTAESQGSKISGLSPCSIISTIGSRFFNSTSEEPTGPKKTTTAVIQDSSKKQVSKEKPKKEENQDENPASGKTSRKYLLQVRMKEVHQKHAKHADRDLRRFKAKYNSSVGNIVRDWMSLIYCILILRMNLIKFILKNLPDTRMEDVHLHKQIIMESRIMFNMIRTAQNSSQEKFLSLWTHLEKLIFNSKTCKSGLQLLQGRDVGPRDWKGANDRLTEVQNAFMKTKEEQKAIEQSALDSEITTRETMTHLENLAASKDAEYNALVDKIRELKKKEVQMRGRILINMKSYKDLKAKRQKLMNVEENMEKLKTKQIALTGEYNSKIESLKKEIEQSDQEIRKEKEEKKRIKARLEGFGDFTDKNDC